ncbi:MAG TPA: CPBP family intramembrane glutamic endopeptidase [Chthoniobacterales bacterium]|nr:CPBP family intramembrane glutamic endopeptidase [Chthoniobacterales bacterium]
MTSEPSTEERLPAQLRGFGPVGILAILIILAGNFLFLPLSAILVLMWASLSQTPWREIGYVRPRSWTRTFAVGILFGGAFKFLMKAVVMPLLGAPPINQAYHWVTGNTAALPLMFYLLIVGAGFGEETVYRGWMFERLGKLFGNSGWARTSIVVLTSVVFGLAHYFGQGIPGVEQAFITGLVFGSIFAVSGRLFLLMIAHAAFDLTALALIYSDCETAVAHFFFK